MPGHICASLMVEISAGWYIVKLLHDDWKYHVNDLYHISINLEITNQ